MASQQQQTSSLQAGQSTADGAFRHSSGAQPQSAHRITSLVAMSDEGNVLTNTQFPHLVGKVGSVRHHRGWFALRFRRKFLFCLEQEQHCDQDWQDQEAEQVVGYQ